MKENLKKAEKGFSPIRKTMMIVNL